MVQKRANIEFFYTKQSGYWLDIRDLDVIKLKVKTGHIVYIYIYSNIINGNFLFKTWCWQKWKYLLGYNPSQKSKELLQLAKTIQWS